MEDPLIIFSQNARENIDLIVNTRFYSQKHISTRLIHKIKKNRIQILHASVVFKIKLVYVLLALNPIVYRYLFFIESSRRDNEVPTIIVKILFYC